MMIFTCPGAMWIGWDALQFGSRASGERMPSRVRASVNWIKRSAAGLAGVRRAALLFQRRRNFLETGLGAAFVDQAARRPTDADAPNHLVTGLDQHGAGKQQDSRHAGQRGGGGVGGELRYQFALQILLEERPERDDGVGLATARVQRVRRSAVVFEHGPRESIAGEPSHADLVAELVATFQ